MGAELCRQLVEPRSRRLNQAQAPQASPELKEIDMDNLQIDELPDGDVRVQWDAPSFLGVETITHRLRQHGSYVYFVNGFGDADTQACDGLGFRGPTLMVRDGEALVDVVRRTLQ
jgi:hypothetical protein